MKRNLLLIALISLALLAADVSAGPEMTRHAFTGGGGRSTAGIYTLDGALGQPFADWDTAAPRDQCAGFLCAPQAGSAPPAGSRIYLPLIKK